MSRFAGQLALVTGSSRGIGAATAEALAVEGAHVVLTGRDNRALEAVEERIHAAGGSATIAPLDLTEPDGIARLATAISQRWQALDMLVLNAAILPQLTAVTDIDQTAFNKALTTNVLATQALLAAFDPMLRKSADARVIGLTSTVSSQPRAYWGAYAPAKPLPMCCWIVTRRKPAMSARSGSRWSIPAQPARPCVPEPIRVKTRHRCSRRKPSPRA